MTPDAWARWARRTGQGMAMVLVPLPIAMPFVLVGGRALVIYGAAVLGFGGLVLLVFWAKGKAMVRGVYKALWLTGLALLAARTGAKEMDAGLAGGLVFLVLEGLGLAIDARFPENE